MIDVDYVEVKRGNRGILRRVWIAVMAVFLAAAIGFLIPPAWVLIQEIGAMFSP